MWGKLSPTGLFCLIDLTSVANSAFKHAMDHVTRIPLKWRNFKAEFVTPVSFKKSRRVGGAPVASSPP